MRISMIDFLEEIKSEIMCYEELDEASAKRWEKNFMAIVHSDNKLPYLKSVGSKKYIEMRDEACIFQIVDKYLDTVVHGEEEQYWKIENVRSWV